MARNYIVEFTFIAGGVYRYDTYKRVLKYNTISVAIFF